MSSSQILDICLQEKATQYTNPIGGRELYDKNIFETKGIVLNFIKSKPIEYPQFKNNFVPWLSMIDVMMFNSKVTIGEFLDNYEWI